MRCDNFNNDILQYCFTVSTQITIEVCYFFFLFLIQCKKIELKYLLQTWKSLSEVTTSLELCPLFVATRFVLVEHIQQACSSLPRFHQVKHIYL